MVAHATPQPRVVLSRRNRVLHYLLVYKWKYASGFVALLIATVLALMPPFILQRAIDAIEGGVTRGALVGYAGAILAAATGESLVRYYSRLTVSGTARQIEYRLRGELAGHLLNLDQGFYVGSRTGDLMSRCTNDLQSVRDFIGPTVVDISRIAVILLAGFGFMLTIDVRLTLIAFVYLPVVIALMSYFETNVEKRFQEVQEQLAVLTESSQESVSGIRAIKAYAQEDAEIATFGRANEEMRRRAMRLAIYHAGLLPVMIALTAGGTLLVIWFGGHDVVDGRITIGEFVQFNFILAILANQLSAMGWVVASAQLGVVAMRRINEILYTRPAVADGDDARTFGRPRGEIEYRNVTVRFDGVEVLRDVNIRIPAGDTVAIVGGTGAGKTTLVNLLVRLIDPSDGAVLLDGQDVRTLRLSDLRSSIGFVPQEAYLFSESLRENISYGRPNASDEEYERAVLTSQLSNDLRQLEDGLMTLIGERGVTLSGGQKQRAALARALLKDPPVLVLDDALSHVDTHTEEEILRRLRGFMAGRTTIVIAHRTSTLRSADEIVVLEDGAIAERGTHAVLMASDGVYARLYREQLALERRQNEIAAAAVEVEPEGPGS